MRDKNHDKILQPSKLVPLLQSLQNEPEACSDLLSTLRFFCHPSEEIILNDNHNPEAHLSNIPQFEAEIDKIIDNCYTFLTSHRFSLLELYGEEFQDLIEDVPDPKVLPIKLLDDFVYIKKHLGLWSAERAALLMIIKIDKLKTREKYERHYLLLSVLYTEMVKIRKICEAAFEELSEIEKLMQYSTPKLLRLVQVLRQYKPEHVCRSSKGNAQKNKPQTDSDETTKTQTESDETPPVAPVAVSNPVTEARRHR